MFRSHVAPWPTHRAPARYERRHESVAYRFWDTFSNVERVDSLINGFPFRVFEGEVPNTLELGRRKSETEAVTSYSHVEERIVEELPILVRDVAMFFLQKELFLASLDVRSNGIKVVVRVPE